MLPAEESAVLSTARPGFGLGAIVGSGENPLSTDGGSGPETSKPKIPGVAPPATTKSLFADRSSASVPFSAKEEPEVPSGPNAVISGRMTTADAEPTLSRKRLTVASVRTRSRERRLVIRSLLNLVVWCVTSASPCSAIAEAERPRRLFDGRPGALRLSSWSHLLVVLINQWSGSRSGDREASKCKVVRVRVFCVEEGSTSANIGTYVVGIED